MLHLDPEVHPKAGDPLSASPPIWIPPKLAKMVNSVGFWLSGLEGINGGVYSDLAKFRSCSVALLERPLQPRLPRWAGVGGLMQFLSQSNASSGSTPHSPCPTTALDSPRPRPGVAGRPPPRLAPAVSPEQRLALLWDFRGVLYRRWQSVEDFVRDAAHAPPPSPCGAGQRRLAASLVLSDEGPTRRLCPPADDRDPPLPLHSPQ